MTPPCINLSQRRKKVKLSYSGKEAENRSVSLLRADFRPEGIRAVELIKKLYTSRIVESVGLAGQWKPADVFFIYTLDGKGIMPE